MKITYTLPDTGSVSIEYSDRPGDDGRDRYKWTVSVPDVDTFTGEDLQSGCQGGSLTEGMQSLLSFLLAAAESYRYYGLDYDAAGPDSNCILFPREVVEWAYQNQSELESITLETE